MAENGAFIIQTCQIGNYSIRGYNTTDPDSIRLSDVINVLVENTGANVGNIPTCLAFYSTVADLSGNVYQTVVIGTQTWMAENLRSSSYANGDEILGDSSNNWSSLSAGAWMYYEDNDQYGDLYGKLYNPLAVTDPRNVCPAGWHVPSDSEWLILTEFLGGENVAGDKMKTTSGWEAPYTTATNESGFSGLPGGDYVGFIGFVGIHNEGAWWSNEGTNIYLLNSNSSNFSFQPDPGIFESSGFSVRCLKNN
jgi:uncharacterized protein (TIGR02145 family)